MQLRGSFSTVHIGHLQVIDWNGISGKRIIRLPITPDVVSLKLLRKNVNHTVFRRAWKNLIPWGQLLLVILKNLHVVDDWIQILILTLNR